MSKPAFERGDKFVVVNRAADPALKIGWRGKITRILPTPSLQWGYLAKVRWDDFMDKKDRIDSVWLNAISKEESIVEDTRDYLAAITGE